VFTREVASRNGPGFKSAEPGRDEKVFAMTCSYRRTGIWLLVILGFGTAGLQSAFADETPTEHLEKFETVPGLKYGIDFDLYVGSKMSELKGEK